MHSRWIFLRSLALLAIACFCNHVLATEFFYSQSGTGDGLSQSEPLPFATFNTATFNAGDVINILSVDGPITSPLNIDGDSFASNSGNPITIRGDGNTIISVDTFIGSAGIMIQSANFIVIEDLAIDGNGGQAALRFDDSGNLAPFFNVICNDVEIINNNGNGAGNHDGISLNANSKVVFHRPIVRKTRPNIPAPGSHQSITAHTNSHAIAYDANFSDTNYWAAPVDDSTIIFYGGTFTQAHVGSFEIGSNGTSLSFIKVIGSASHPLSIELAEASLPRSMSNISSDNLIEISGGTLTKISDQNSTHSNRGKLILKNMDLTISQQKFNYLGLNGSTITLQDNTISLVHDEQPFWEAFFKLSDQAGLTMERNLFLYVANSTLVKSQSENQNDIRIVGNVFANLNIQNLDLIAPDDNDIVTIAQNYFKGEKNISTFIAIGSDTASGFIKNNIFEGCLNAANYSNNYSLQYGSTSNNAFFECPAVGQNPVVHSPSDFSGIESAGSNWWGNSTAPLDFEDIPFSIPPNIGPFADLTVTAQGATLFATPDNFLTDELSSVSGNLFINNGNGFDYSNNKMPYSIESINGIPVTDGQLIELESGALLSINYNGNFAYDPNGQFSNLDIAGQFNDTFTYEISNAFSAATSAVVNIIVLDINDPPTLSGDTAVSLFVDEILEIPVLATDPENQTLLFSLSEAKPRFVSISQLSNNNALLRLQPRSTEYGTYQVTVTVEDGGLPAKTNQLSISVSVNQRPNRITDGLIALYEFNDGAGTKIADTSGYASRLDIGIPNLNDIEWNPLSLKITAATTLISNVSAQKISSAIMQSGEISIEAWVKPENLNMSLPGRIIGLANGSLSENFSLSQQHSRTLQDHYNIKFRTENTDAIGVPSLSSAEDSVQTALTHIVYTRNQAGEAIVYINGQLSSQRTSIGSLNNWESNMLLIVGNQYNNDMPWLGDLHLLAVYDTALTVADIQQNYFATADPPADTEIPFPLWALYAQAFLIFSAALAFAAKSKNHPMGRIL